MVTAKRSCVTSFINIITIQRPPSSPGLWYSTSLGLRCILAPELNQQRRTENPLSVDLWSEAGFDQKLEYIHNNPLLEKWHLAELPENYRYSSAGFYATGHDEFGLMNIID